jgi:hypothetical protein
VIPTCLLQVAWRAHLLLLSIVLPLPLLLLLMVVVIPSLHQCTPTHRLLVLLHGRHVVALVWASHRGLGSVDEERGVPTGQAPLLPVATSSRGHHMHRPATAATRAVLRLLLLPAGSQPRHTPTGLLLLLLLWRQWCLWLFGVIHTTTIAATDTASSNSGWGHATAATHHTHTADVFHLLLLLLLGVVLQEWLLSP